MTVDLRPLAGDDAPLMRKWLAEPHVRQWRAHRPDLSAAEDMMSVHALGFVIVADGKPAGFIGAYNCYAQPDPVRDTRDPPETWGFNVFIGETSLLRRGIATAAIGALIADLPRICNCDRLIVEAHVASRPAIGLCEKAGFTMFATIDDDAEGGHHLMVRGMQLEVTGH
jgi:aminoglycoside 6'-N-acetyltransferase